jgi:DNA-binding NarL/FixJ family response regulator
MVSIRVVLADDHPGMIATVREVLDDEVELIEVVQNGDEAVTAVLTLDPDILVTDISMPVLSGLQAALAIQRANCRTKVIFLTIHEEGDFIAAALSAGAAGYVFKRCMAIDLFLAIRASLDGRVFVSNSTMQ